MIRYLFFRKIDDYIKKYKSTLEFSHPNTTIRSFGKSKGSEINFEQLNSYLIENNKIPFSSILFELIDKSGKTDSAIYKAAGVDRRVFSKIRCNKSYIPKKRTIIAIGIALNLSRYEFDQLLASAGYALSYGTIFDLIIMFCIEHKIYSIAKINIALEHYGIDLFNTEG